MAKRLIGKKELTKLFNDRSLLVEQALDNGLLIKSDICNATGLKMTILNAVFAENRELYARYTVLRRTVTDVAADNIVSIVMDKTHPKNYEASKEVLKNFKTDLDNTLEKKDGDEIRIETTGKATSPVKIVFGNTSKKDEDE